MRTLVLLTALLICGRQFSFGGAASADSGLTLIDLSLSDKGLESVDKFLGKKYSGRFNPSSLTAAFPNFSIVALPPSTMMGAFGYGYSVFEIYREKEMLAEIVQGDSESLGGVRILSPEVPVQYGASVGDTFRNLEGKIKKLSCFIESGKDGLGLENGSAVCRTKENGGIFYVVKNPPASALKTGDLLKALKDKKINEIYWFPTETP